MTQIDITWEQVKELVPKRTSLTYVDYRDSLDDHAHLIMQCIEEGDESALCEASWEWFVDAECDAIDYYIKELRSDLINKFNLTEEEAKEVTEKFDTELDELLRDRDDSTPLKDLWRNTSDQTMFYDTGYEVEDGSWAWNEERMNQEVKAIKKYLGISRNKKEWDNDLSTLIANAGYGGQLVVYFYEDAQDFIKTSEYKTIAFKNFHLAIINTGNGSGHDVHMSKCSISLPFVRENIYLDKTIKYSYTFSVCGMSRDWCSDTAVEFSEKELKKFKLEKSSLAQVQAQDAEYAKIFKAGSCSAGDMDINRHRRTTYINNFPCGTRCEDCQTFWID